MFTKTHQGVVRQPGPLPKLISHDYKVISNSPDPYLAIKKHIDRCVDATFSAYFDKNMLEDACNTYFNDAIKEIDSKIANYQQYNATSTFAFAQHIHTLLEYAKLPRVLDLPYS